MPPNSTPEMRFLVVELNRVFALIEDRLDELEARRGTQTFTTQTWEREY
jgi:hypothetical protein